MPLTSPTGRSSGVRPAHHANKHGTLFRNPWPSAEKPSWNELLSISNPLSWYSTHELEKHAKAREIKALKPDWGASDLKARGLQRQECIIGTWLGHAGAMVEMPVAAIDEGSGRKSLSVLFDPIFSTRAGPNAYTGPSRLKPSPCQALDLPACDAVVISHNHYDHLDLVTIKAVLAKFPRCLYFVPRGNKGILMSTGIPGRQIHEMDWWSSLDLACSDFGFEAREDVSDHSGLRFTCVPAQHNSGRGATDQGHTLWSGWVVESFSQPESAPSGALRARRGGIYHAGDTGYRRTARSDEVCPVFAEVGERLGPFDLAFIPLWRGGTLGLISYMGLRLSHQEIPSVFHASPADAIAIHQAVKSRTTVGVHFGTFIGSEHESYEAIIEFEDAREKQGIATLEASSRCEHGRAGVLDIGGSIAIRLDTA
ncbi:hypothetical protein QTJ16_003596 [Diplocarpon rosae]|uniref:Metallo-beta-lactamase domain-containing protein n=1 Tax=Diplocarpon rosae TaxID=946125 RepID=A0AAD9WDS2_9HELO|nr:hypothetical protein QTJ16_003596 [Diplocarpon rosae]